MTARPHLPASVRARATLAAALVVAVALAAGAVVLVAVLQDNLASSAQTAAAVRANDIATLASSGRLRATVALPDDETAFVQVVTSSGRVVAASGNLRGKPPAVSLRPNGEDPVTATVGNVPVDPDERFVVVALAASTAQGPVVVYSGSSLEAADEAVHAAEVALLVGVPLLVALVAALTWLVVRRSLSPVEAIRTQVAEISSRDLHRRVPEPGVRDEIGRLAVTMNAMLDRLDRAVERQQAFVADASHELRSPLATLRSELEIALAHPDGRWEHTARDALLDVARIEHVAGDLLLLARLDASPAARRAPVDLAELVSTEVARLPAKRRARCHADLASGVAVTGDPSQLARLVRNLLDNAARHARRTVTVIVRPADPTDRAGRSGEVVVADDGPGIPPGDRERVFDRFTRLDDARARDEGGAGLGLAIARQIVTIHGGTIRVADSDEGACLVVRLPLALPSTVASQAAAGAMQRGTTA